MRDPDARASIGRLKRRADFLHVAKGKRWHAAAMTMQVHTAIDATAAPRVGFTLTRKVGNAVVRNRARRRLKEAVRLSPSLPLDDGHDYVIIGRIDAVRLPFETLKQELLRGTEGVRNRRPASDPFRTPRAKRTEPRR